MYEQYSAGREDGTMDTAEPSATIATGGTTDDEILASGDDLPGV